MHRGFFLVLFALSGAAALVYEVVWTRLLTLDVGHGLAAASTVLAAFMGGLALGAAAGGRMGQRLSPREALRTYARLELAIAGAALVLPWLLSLLGPLLGAVYANGHGGVLFGTVRLVSTLILLAGPAAAMGATFPIASRWMVRQASTLSVDAGTLYAANTLGAAAGALTAGFVLLPSLGLSGATWVGMALNILAAGGAWYLADRVVTDEPAADTPAPAAASSTRPGRVKDKGRGRHGRRGPVAPTTPAMLPEEGRVGLAAAALGVTGFASLALQVVWTRLLASVLGPTTYAFSAVVAVFILGIAGGSIAGTWLTRRGGRPVTLLALVVALSGLLALIAATQVDAAVMTVARLVAAPDITFSAVLLREWWLAATLLLPMALTFGLAFPLALAVASRTSETAVEDLGLVYAVNTLGAIAGSLLAGFVLVPWLGLHGTTRLVAAFTALAAAGLGLFAARRAPWVPLAASLAGLLAATFLPAWNPLLFSSGAYKYAGAIQGPDLETALTAGSLEYYREGATATVAVRKLAGATSLSIDGKVDASDSADMLTQRLLAHVPLLLHPAPSRAAILGLGSGVTLGSALTHGLEQAVVLEISPEVVEASHHFDTVNHRPLDDGRTRLIVGDGRTHLRLSDEQYDVIVSEPSNPWMAGIASLFTREFFEIARSRLAPGGVLCQWAHTYDISDGDLKSIVSTFLSVFPDGTLWMVGDGDILLVGSTEPLADRMTGVAEAWQRPSVADDLASVGATAPLAVLSLFVAEGDALRTWAAGAPVQTDRRARLEFTGPQSIFGASPSDNTRLLRDLAAASPRPSAVDAALTGASASDWRAVGEMLLKADSYRSALDHFVRAVERDPQEKAAFDGMVRASVPAGQTTRVGDLLTRMAADPAQEEARLALSRLLAAQGHFNESARLPLALLQTNPGHHGALEQLASVLSDAGDADRLAPVVARLRADAPREAATHYYSASLAFMQNRPDVAIRDAETALVLDPRHARARNLLGATLAGLGQRDRARTAFLAAMEADPRDPAAYANLATLELEAGNRDAARRYFAEALTIDPSNEGAREGLSRVLPAR